MSSGCNHSGWSPATATLPPRCQGCPSIAPTQSAASSCIGPMDETTLPPRAALRRKHPACHRAARLERCRSHHTRAFVVPWSLWFLASSQHCPPNPRGLCTRRRATAAGPNQVSGGARLHAWQSPKSGPALACSIALAGTGNPLFIVLRAPHVDRIGRACGGAGSVQLVGLRTPEHAPRPTPPSGVRRASPSCVTTGFHPVAPPSERMDVRDLGGCMRGRSTGAYRHTLVQRAREHGDW